VIVDQAGLDHALQQSSGGRLLDVGALSDLCLRQRPLLGEADQGRRVCDAEPQRTESSLDNAHECPGRPGDEVARVAVRVHSELC
jgi:hypothetical protein